MGQNFIAALTVFLYLKKTTIIGLADHKIETQEILWDDSLLKVLKQNSPRTISKEDDGVCSIFKTHINFVL